MTRNVTKYQLAKQIKREYGEVTPHTVYEEGRKKDSPLHTYFCWDKTEAAEKWNLHLARKWINSIRIPDDVLQKHPSFPTTVSDIRAWKKDPRKPWHMQGYEEVEIIDRRRTDAALVIDLEIQRLKTAVTTLLGLVEFLRAPHVSALRKIYREVGRLLR